MMNGAVHLLEVGMLGVQGYQRGKFLLRLLTYCFAYIRTPICIQILVTVCLRCSGTAVVEELLGPGWIKLNPDCGSLLCM